MTRYETLSLLISVAALLIALVSLVRTRKAQQQQERLNKVVEELSQRQMEHLERVEAETQRARVIVEMGREIGESCFVLVNSGAAPAQDVTLQIVDYPNPHLLWGPSAEAFPLPILNVGQRFTVHQRHGLNDPLVVHARTGWIDPDGDQRFADSFLSIPVR